MDKFRFPSDLDGDTYFVCWDPRIIPSKTCPPHYRTTLPLPSGSHTPSAFHDELVETFVEQRHKLLGRVSNMWESTAEGTPELTKSACCKALAQIIEELLVSMFPLLPRFPITVLRPSQHRISQKMGLTINTSRNVFQPFSAPIRIRSKVPSRHCGS
jgi:hypothetical protein